MGIYNSNMKAQELLNELSQRHQQFSTEVAVLKDSKRPYGMEQMYAQRRAHAWRLEQAHALLTTHIDWLRETAPEWEQRAKDFIASAEKIIAAFDQRLDNATAHGASYKQVIETPVSQTTRNALAAAIEAELE